MWNFFNDGIASPSAIILCLCLGLYLLFRRKKLNLPPGPRGLPIVGFMPFLSRDEPHLQLEEMRKKYGEVFGMYMGSRYFLILCDIRSTKEAFNREDFTPRPEGSFRVSKEFANFGHTFGQHWVDHRKLATRTIRQLGVKDETIQAHIIDEINTALDRLEKAALQSENGEVELRDSIAHAISAISSNMIFGKSFSPDHEVSKIISRFLKDFAENGTAMTVEQCMPWLKPFLDLLVPQYKKTLKTYKDLENYLWTEIEAHEKHPPEHLRDYLNYYLKERMKPNMSDRFTRPDMNGDAQVLLFAGADTVRSVIEWFVLCMAKFPAIQEKCYQEIRADVDTYGDLEYENRSRVPYTEACVLETMRLNTTAPLNPVHSTTKEVLSFHGYDIPEESVVVSCIWSIHNDPENWSHPHTFHPEHFLSSDGRKLEIPEYYIPFSTGKRMCIAEKLAHLECFQFAIRFLQRFQVFPPDGGVSMAGRMRVSWEARFPRVRLVPRGSSK